GDAGRHSADPRGHRRMESGVRLASGLENVMSGNHEMRHLSWSAKVLLAALALALPSSATATVYSCNEAGLDAGLSAGGLVQFGCAVASTIPITSSKTVAVSGTTIDGQDRVTFQGSPGFRLF